MRIFDLLNDGDAAVALLASAHAPAAPPDAGGRSPTPSSPRQESRHLPFPSLVLPSVVTKPWKAPAETVESPLPGLGWAGKAATKGAPKPQPEHEHEHAAKTMSIFDIVASNARSGVLRPTAARKSAGRKNPVPARQIRAVGKPPTTPAKRVRAAAATTTSAPDHARPADEEDDEEDDDDAPMDSQAQKRKRQRVLFRRNYYKRMNTIAEMRELRAELEVEYQQLMWKRNAEQMVQTYLRQGQARLPIERRREQYMDRCRDKDLLRTENSALERVLQDVRKVHDKMRWLVDAEGGLRPQDRLDLALCPAACQAADPMSPCECDELSRQCRDLILNHVLPSGVPRRAAAPAPAAFGWDVRRQHFMARRVLVAEKLVRAGAADADAHTEPLALANKLWQMLAHSNESKGEAIRAIVGRALVHKCFVVERVSPAHLIVYVEFTTGGGGHDDDPRHALCLISKTSSTLQDPDDVMVTIQALPAPCTASGRWIQDLMAWVRFSPARALDRTGTQLSLGTSLPSGGAPQEEHWLRLLVIASVQLETHLVAAPTIL